MLDAPTSDAGSVPEYTSYHANRIKREFLATMSHEIRTPINAIIGYADLLDAEISGPLTEGQRSQVERIRGASQHLLSLITEILDLAKADSGRMVLRHEPQRALATIEGALAAIHSTAAAKGIQIDVQCQAGCPLTYMGDDDRMRQMLVNLLSNAIKFSEHGRVVTVMCTLVAEDTRPPLLANGSTYTPDIVHAEAGMSAWICFQVRDHGIGIAAKDLERIFDPFVQVDPSYTRTHGGTGLGLTITRRLARLMGGELTAQSIPNVGSTFTIWIPATTSSHTRPHLPPNSGASRL